MKRPILWSALVTALVLMAGASVYVTLKERRYTEAVDAAAEENARVFAEEMRKLELEQRWEKLDRERKEREVRALDAASNRPGHER